jgi:hypothetical protein
MARRLAELYGALRTAHSRLHSATPVERGVF